MAEPNPKSESSSTPSLAAVPDPQAPAKTEEARKGGRGGAPWWLFAVLVLLLVGTLWGLVGQTRHARAQAVEISELTAQVGELEGHLSELSSQLAGFGMQRELVNVSVDDLIERLTRLQLLVRWDPRQPGSAPPAAGGEEAPREPSASAEPADPAAASDAPADPAASAEGGSDLDLDSVPALRPGPSLQLAPRDQV